MYGMVNNALKDLIRSERGEDGWDRVRAAASVEDDSFFSTEPYPDDLTYRLLEAAAKELDITPEEVQHRFGKWWVLKTGLDGYGHLMRGAGSNLREFLFNLPNFHTRVGLFFPALKPPEFECTDVSSKGLRLHYRSTRAGLAPFVVGLLAGLGEMFDTPVKVVHEQRAGDGADHDVFHVEWGGVP
jgi:hypothetical protein